MQTSSEAAETTEVLASGGGGGGSGCDNTGGEWWATKMKGRVWKNRSMLVAGAPGVGYSTGGITTAYCNVQFYLLDTYTCVKHDFLIILNSLLFFFTFTSLVLVSFRLQVLYIEIYISFIYIYYTRIN